MTRICACLAITLALLLGAPMAQGATMHDNKVYFVNCSSFSFHETGHHITSGQPWGGIKSSHSGSTGTLLVKAGRHASDDVADWFNHRVDLSIGTRHSGDVGTPGQLNFAIHGDLELGEKGSLGSKVLCKGIAIGQGHVGAYNNWWIGAESSVIKEMEGEVWLECPAVDGYAAGIIILNTHDSDQFKLSIRTCPAN